jgi:hypothetical protein
MESIPPSIFNFLSLFVSYYVLLMADYLSYSWMLQWRTVLAYSCIFVEYKPGIFLFATVSSPALGPTQPPIQWVPGALSLGVKWPGREADHSPPSSAEVKNSWSCTSTPQYAFMARCSIKAQGHLYLYILYTINSARRPASDNCTKFLNLVNIYYFWTICRVKWTQSPNLNQILMWPVFQKHRFVYRKFVVILRSALPRNLEAFCVLGIGHRTRILRRTKQIYRLSRREEDIEEENLGLPPPHHLVVLLSAKEALAMGILASCVWCAENTTIIKSDYKWCDRFLPTNLCNRSHHL